VNQICFSNKVLGYIIEQHLLGIGPGNFEFAYLPYHHSVAQDFEITEPFVRSLRLY